MTEPTLLQEVYKQESRPNPWPIYAEMRKTPVAAEPDGTYVVSTYDEIVQLLHDPRISSDVAKHSQTLSSPGFINTDPPVHDRLRRLATSHFGPPHRPDLVAGLEQWLQETVDALVDKLEPGEIDVVDQISYPFPVSAICRVLGVPPEDEPKFHGWSSVLIQALGARFDTGDNTKLFQAAIQANTELLDYLRELAETHRKDPGDDIISGLVTDSGPDGRMNDDELLGTCRLLLIAGHETTVNLITNGMLTLLRHSEQLERLRNDPGYAIPMVEELLRFEPPVQAIPSRYAVGDIEVGGTTIPNGAHVVLMVASGSRDDRRFSDPDTFNPDRPEREHLGLGGGVHYCFGAPLARLEVQIALRTLARRLENPRLVEDPPPYRPSPILRGPIHLRLKVDGIRPA
jgi:cytochrome P450